MLKLLVILGLAAFVAAVPLDSWREEIEQLKLLQMEQEALYLRQHSSSRFFRRHQKNSVEPLDDVPARNYRLPNDTFPVHYDIYLRTSIHNGNPVFTGVVRIDISVIEATNSITLQSRQHIIQGLGLFNQDGSAVVTTLTYTYDSDTEFLTILSSTELTVGQQLTVQVSYTGLLNNFSERGFISNSFIDPATSETVWMAQSHLQPVNPRHAYPCYDEPRYRQTVAFRIEHHASYNAIFSLPVREIQEAPEGFVVTVFETTPAMPIHILTFSVNRLDFVSTTDDMGREFRVFSRPEAIEAGEADNALALGVSFLREMENIFNITDMLPKSDQIAMPQFIANGAGNWGFICVREEILLQTNDNPVEQHLREMRLAHEYSVDFAGLCLIFSYF